MENKIFKGFSLIELMVIIAILSVAAAIIFPRYLKHQSQLRRQECLENLKSLQAKEIEYFEKNHAYTHDLNSLGWSPQGKRYQYQFFTDLPLDKGFSFICQGNIDRDPIIDTLSINEKGEISQIINDATQ